VRTLVAAGLVLGLLAGCAGRWTYDKAGVTPGALDRDLAACRSLAHRPYWFAFTRAARVDQDALNQCMQHRGYSARRDD